MPFGIYSNDVQLQIFNMEPQFLQYCTIQMRMVDIDTCNIQ